ncbi:MAG TPA: GreA/GreB family elongation factor [Clostridia bacterium]|nr:GreA/GreB family elongation factor [Clostridia bacterium]
MGAQYKMAKPTFESLVSHLVNLEDEKDQLIEELFPETTRERKQFAEFLDEYIAKVNHLIKNTVTSDSEKSFPFVTIGSKVKIKDLESGEKEELRLVNPIQTSVDDNAISYLSPVGKALILKKVGDIVEVTAPGGKFRYKVEAIEFP